MSVSEPVEPARAGTCGWSGLYAEAVGVFDVGEVTMLAAPGSPLDDPYLEFEAAPSPDPFEQVDEWLRLWTGGSAAPSERLTPIGQDGSGGIVFVYGPPEEFEASPVVFLGSEGQNRVIAADIADFLVLLSRGYELPDPVDAAAATSPRSSEPLTALLERRVPERLEATDEELVDRAQAALPGFQEEVESWVGAG
jgi:hypothetical protein